MSEANQPQTRRAVLGAALGGLAGLLMSAFGRPQPVRGAHGDMHVEANNLVDAATKVTNQVNDQTVFFGHSKGAGIGIAGRSERGVGVRGKSLTSTGVHGDSTSGAGLKGVADVGIGVQAESPNGWALSASGRLDLSNSGRISLPAGETTLTVTPGTDVTKASFVLLTPHTNLEGRDLWATLDEDADTFAIHMSSTRPTGTPVGWLLLR